MPPKLKDFLKDFEDKVGLPSLTSLVSLVSGESGRRVESVITKLERLSRNHDTIKEATELLRIVQALGATGDLERLDSILRNLPKGKRGQAMLADVKELISTLDSKLEKLTSLASTILSKDN